MRSTNLKIARVRAGIKQIELARRIDLDPTTLSRMENGKIRPSLKRLQMLSNELNISIDELARDFPVSGISK